MNSRARSIKGLFSAKHTLSEKLLARKSKAKTLEQRRDPIKEKARLLKTEDSNSVASTANLLQEQFDLLTSIDNLLPTPALLPRQLKARSVPRKFSEQIHLPSVIEEEEEEETHSQETLKRSNSNSQDRKKKMITERESTQQPLCATQLWDALVDYLEEHVNAGRRRKSFRWYNDCFQGSEACDCLLKFFLHKLSRRVERDQVNTLLGRFMTWGVIDAVLGRDRHAPFRESCLYQLTFQHFWRQIDRDLISGSGGVAVKKITLSESDYADSGINSSSSTHSTVNSLDSTVTSTVHYKSVHHSHLSLESAAIYFSDGGSSDNDDKMADMEVKAILQSHSDKEEDADKTSLLEIDQSKRRYSNTRPVLKDLKNLPSWSSNTKTIPSTKGQPSCDHAKEAGHHGNMRSSRSRLGGSYTELAPEFTPLQDQLTRPTGSHFGGSAECLSTVGGQEACSRTHPQVMTGAPPSIPLSQKSVNASSKHSRSSKSPSRYERSKVSGASTDGGKAIRSTENGSTSCHVTTKRRKSEPDNQRKLSISTDNTTTTKLVGNSATSTKPVGSSKQRDKKSGVRKTTNPQHLHKKRYCDLYKKFMAGSGQLSLNPVDFGDFDALQNKDVMWQFYSCSQDTGLSLFNQTGFIQPSLSCSQPHEDSLHIVRYGFV